VTVAHLENTLTNGAEDTQRGKEGGKIDWALGRWTHRQTPALSPERKEDV
jgi:hypothetical protein